MVALNYSVRLTVYFRAVQVAFRWRRRLAGTDYVPNSLTFPVYVRLVCVCLVSCGKTAERISMPFGVVGLVGPMMCVVRIGVLITPRE